jgi:hypothetical protein
MGTSHFRRALAPVAVAAAAVVWALAGGAATASATVSSFSGEGCVVKAQVLDLSPLAVGCATLPATGGAEQSSLLTVPSTSLGPVGTLNGAEVFGAHTVGQGNQSDTNTSVASLDATVEGQNIQATFLASHAHAACGAGGAAVSGSSELAGLTVNGGQIAVGVQPNTVLFNQDGIMIVANAQSGGAAGNDGAIDVTALQIVVSGVGEVDLVTAHADIHCVPANPGGPGSCPVGNDFITGGGWFYGLPQTSGQRHFADAAGWKNGGIWGHLEYMDKAANVKVEGDPVWYGPSAVSAPVMFDQGGNMVTPDQLAAELFGTPSATNPRYIVGTLNDGLGYLVRTVDGGEPGAHVDQFDIAFLNLDTGLFGPTGSFSYQGAYLAASDPSGIEGGNVQLHRPCGG